MTNLLVCISLTKKLNGAFTLICQLLSLPSFNRNETDVEKSLYPSLFLGILILKNIKVFQKQSSNVQYQLYYKQNVVLVPQSYHFWYLILVSTKYVVKLSHRGQVIKTYIHEQAVNIFMNQAIIEIQCNHKQKRISCCYRYCALLC